jgi:hypothetical protein
MIQSPKYNLLGPYARKGWKYYNNFSVIVPSCARGAYVFRAGKSGEEMDNDEDNEKVDDEKVEEDRSPKDLRENGDVGSKVCSTNFVQEAQTHTL